MADSAIDRVHVVNRALIKLGLPASYSIDDESELGGQVDLVWPGTVARVMALHDWSVFRKTVRPVALSSFDPNGWQYGFSLPADRVGNPIAVLSDVQREAYLRDFMYEGGLLFTNVSAVWVRIRVMQDPQYWDSAFVEAFAIALASALAVPLLQDVELEQSRARDAFGDEREQGGGGLFGKLITLDRASHPQGRGFLSNAPLIAARR